MISFFEGLWIGLCIGMLVEYPILAKSRVYGAKIGFISGLGRLCAVGIYLCIAVLGYSLFYTYIYAFKSFGILFGSILCVLVGFFLIIKKTNENQNNVSSFLDGFLKIIKHPVLILCFIVGFLYNDHWNLFQFNPLIGIMFGVFFWNIIYGFVLVRIQMKPSIIQKIFGFSLCFIGYILLLQNLI